MISPCKQETLRYIEVAILNIYIDESGSINNNSGKGHDFVITLVVPTDKKRLDRVYKRFVSRNYNRLEQIDEGNKMFLDGKFHELKGSQFNRPMKQKFVRFFSQEKCFELYYIRIKNYSLSDKFCGNTARAFNYVLRLALQYFITNNYFKGENYTLQLDERNEKTESKYFLENYLNTELTMGGVTDGKFSVFYFDSANNKFIQIADVFSNLFYSQLLTNAYNEEMEILRNKNILKFIFEFPPFGVDTKQGT